MADNLPPLPEPMDYCYEWDGPWGTRKFSPNQYNGKRPDRSVALFNAEQMRAYALAARQADEALMREAMEALELGRDYVNAELLHRQAAYDGYPHKWETERADLLSVDATLSKLKERLQ